MCSFALMSLLPLQAQFSLSLSAGMNHSNVDKSDSYALNTALKQGLYVALTPAYALNEKLSIRADLQYSDKGYSVVDGLVTELKTRPVYLDIMPAVEYKLNALLSAGLGFNAALLLGEKVKHEGGEWQEILASIYTSNDFGVFADLKATHKNFFVTIRYNHGLKDVNNIGFTDENGEPLNDISLRNRNWQFGAGYTYTFASKNDKSTDI